MRFSIWRSSIWQAPPFKLLLHLEWILLGIAVISSLSPLSVRLRGLSSEGRDLAGLSSAGRDLAGQEPGWLVAMSLASLVFVLLLGAMGWRLPLGLGAGLVVGRRKQSALALGNSPEDSRGDFRGDFRGDSGHRRRQGLPLALLYIGLLYIGGGFGLSWLAVLFGGRGVTLFPPLLLIVVTRGCVLFPRRGRWLVAGAALASFMAMQYLALQRVRPLGIPLDRLPRLPGSRHLPDELVHSLRLNAMVNVTLLFVLVLGFVLLLVQALVQEAQSRQQLAEVNQRLRRYSLRIEDQAALQERSRIAREIHDTVGHCLTAQSIQLENVALQLGDGPGQEKRGQEKLSQEPLSSEGRARAVAHLDQARRLGREALQNVRQAVARLRIHPLQGQSLEGAIAQLVQEFQAHSPIQLSRNIDLKQSPPEDIAIVLYRILQEGLTNLTKHSQATAAQLHIYQDLEGWHLRLSDNGIGFDPAQNTTGFGLQSMTERAEAVQGHFQWVSLPGQGCALALDIPI